MRAGRGLRRALLAALSIALVAPAAAQAAGAPPEFYGVVSQAGLADEDFARMKDNGVGIMRLQLSWKKVQPSEGECHSDLPLPPGSPLPVGPACDWGYYDRIIGGAAAAGVEVLPYLLNVPAWISEHENEPPIRTDAERAAGTEWLGAVVGRYGPSGTFWTEEYAAQHPGAVPLPIRRWQVWNEPSDGTFWHPNPNAAEYGDLVELTAAGIRAADPGAEIILAGVFGTPNEENGGIDAKPFLRSLFRSRDLSGSFDSLALHPYGPKLKRSLGQVKAARKVFDRAGFGDRPTWITELGWASGGRHPQLSKTPALQAKLLQRAYAAYERKRVRWNIAGVTWFAWQDTDDRNVCAFCSDVGLVTVDRREKPALTAYRVTATGG
jgi:hypothetical protein